MIRLDSSAPADRAGRAGARSGRDFFADARLVIVVGKGGVGKTVLTTSLAVAGARRGLETLIVEVDGKNHVATVLGTAPGGYEERTLIEPDPAMGRGRVAARTITPERALADYLDEHGFGRISDQLSRGGLIDLLATSTPGIKDLLVLGKIKHLERSSSADLILVDAPASGHAVTFLKSAAALADTARSGRIHRQAVDSLDLLRDPTRCQALLVTLPEETPVNETIDTARILRKEIGIELGVVVVNGIWESAVGDDPPAPSDRSAVAHAARFERSIANRHAAQTARLEAVLTEPIVRVPAVRDTEIGRDQIEDIAARLDRELRTLPERRRSKTRRVIRDVNDSTDAMAVSTAGETTDIAPLRDLVSRHRIVVCAGTGGAGKTTTAAALAIGAARLGRRAVVVTIDPAKRLADALGITNLTNEPSEVAGDWSGSLHAMMLDAKRTFDDLILTASRDDEQAARVLANGFYQNLSSSLSGSQELMAMQRLHELHESALWDLIVVDTPPTRNALAFLDAPSSLTRLLESRLFRAVTAPGRGVFRLMSRATQTVVRQIGRIIGTEVVDDAVAFLQSVDGIIEGFQERTREVVALLSSDDTAFVLVASARRDTIIEALWFNDRLADARLPVRALVLNRLTPGWTGSSRRRAATPEAWSAAEAALVRGREIEHSAVAPLIAAVGDVPIARLPLLANDVHDIDSLSALSSVLVGVRPPRRRAPRAPREPTA